MDKGQAYFAELFKRVEQNGIWIDRREHGFPKEICGHDYIVSHTYMFLIHQGTADVIYDMQEATMHPNELAVLLPGHIIRFGNTSEDFIFTRATISKEFMEDLQFHVFSHDGEKFHYQPVCQLTDEYAERVMSLATIFAAIIEHSNLDLPLRRNMLLAQMAVGYEFINYYRREQDKQWEGNRNAAFFARFRDLVVAHYRESREVQFYADQLHLHPYHFTRVIRAASGGHSPADWIEQYVITQAKKMIEFHPNLSLKQIAFMLGFSDPSSFYRYFKHGTGITAKEYRDSIRSITSAQ